MITIEVNERTKAGKVLLEMARLLGKDEKGVKVIEKAVVEGKTNEPVDIEFILKNKGLSEAEIAFYRKFQKSVQQVKAAEAGDLKTRSLSELLDEI